MDPSYYQTKDFTPFCAKVDFVMNNFDELKLILKEKKVKLEEIHGWQVETRDVHHPTPITMGGSILIHQKEMQHSSSWPPLPKRADGMVEKRIVHEFSQKREREETSDE